MHNMPVSAQLLMRDAGSQADAGGPVRGPGLVAGVSAPRRGGAAPELKVKEDAPMFLETAHTKLPIEFRGVEVHLEAHAYEDESASYQAMAVVHRPKGHVTTMPVVRVHSGCVTGDIFHSLRCDCYQQLQKALERIVDSDYGIIIYLPYHEGRGIGLVKKLQAYAEQDRGLDTVDANLSVGAPVDSRDYELAAKILKDLEATDIRLMTNNPLKVEALRGHGINVVEQVAHIVEPSPYNARYLATKKERMAHKL
jgi:GTP cyclohydrolase II/3,4-dihydroxy 2-butanone 4-phosphate synthase/GTP cyclohydrolase II